MQTAEEKQSVEKALAEYKAEWAAALKHADDLILEYAALIGDPKANPIFALSQIHALKSRYNKGERTQKLLEELKGIE